jgi:putative sigma-54 modulation protein
VRLQVKGKNVEVSDSLYAYAEEKLGKLDRHLNESARLELELAVERNPSIAASQVAEATVWTKGPILRARESSEDMHASIDLLVEKLERQVKRYREKRHRKQIARHAPHHQPDDEAIPVVPAESEPVIVKTKQFAVKPMTPDEAVLQLELIGHDFFVFRNAETNEVNVVYRRRDANYGLIEPRG